MEGELWKRIMEENYGRRIMEENYGMIYYGI
jgi:hypothetical protein